MTAASLALAFPAADIALITFDTPGKGANILSSSVLEELRQILDGLRDRKDLKGLVLLSGKPGIFIAGADLREFVVAMPTVTPQQTAELCRRGQQLFARLADLPMVTVAAIHGTCLGGGTELACWCDRRVMSNADRTEIGLPEVKLGLIPGWGGTVRLPRIVGLALAVEMITGGEPVDARHSLQMGLVSDVVEPDQLLAASINLVRSEHATASYLSDRTRWAQPLPMDATEKAFLGAAASAQIQQHTKGAYPAPQAALDLMLESTGLPAAAACSREAETMGTLFGSSVNRALLNVFFLTDRIKKDTGLAATTVASREIRRVGVIGAGIMGSGIAGAEVKRSVPTTLMDADEKALARGVRQAFEDVAYNKKTKRADAQRTLQAAPLLHATSELIDLAACDLVVEAVVENADVKRQIYSQLEPRLRADAILASNTSTIPITKLAEKLERPERFCGLHFFNPVNRMQLVEVIRGRKTSDETIATVVAHAKRIGKHPIVVADGPGFLVNRLLFPYMNEAIQLVTEGVGLQEIDRAAKAYGMPMGPIALYDMVGIDTAFYAGRTMWEAFPDRVAASPILPMLMKQGRLGQKSGAGFFSYKNKRGLAQLDPGLEPLLAPYCSPPHAKPLEEIIARLTLPMLLEATRVLEEQVVRDARDVDFGLIYGLGFPAYRGGLLFDADAQGTAKIAEQLRAFESLGARFRPTPLLLELAKDGKKFYREERA